jgi:hypothetical protein
MLGLKKDLIQCLDQLLIVQMLNNIGQKFGKLVVGCFILLDCLLSLLGLFLVVLDASYRFFGDFVGILSYLTSDLTTIYPSYFIGHGL